MGLESLQERLVRRFTDIGRRRGSRGDGRPLFALEHGLTEEEFTHLACAVREAAATGDCRSVPPLLWIVYASEMGYGYSGLEYWQSFEGQTPGWELQDRDWLRSRFREFSREFGAARPSGCWAENFGIIAWPITHAILPADLQYHFVRLLDDFTQASSGGLPSCPTELGELIAASSWRCSSRFQVFVRDPALTGQIAAALLYNDSVEHQDLISPEALRRIVDDLEARPASKHYLHSARSRAQRARLLGFSRGASSLPGGRDADEDLTVRAVAGLGIRPRLIMRPTAQDTWQVVLEIPSLAPLLAAHDFLNEALAQSYCTVAGAPGVMRPPGYFLNGPRRTALREWPDAGEELLCFDICPKELSRILRTKLMIDSGPSWLLRKERDKTAGQVLGRAVRADQEYSCLAKSEIIDACPVSMPRVDVECEGVACASLVPRELTDEELSAALELLELTRARSVRASPVGLPPSAWDGEGHAEWLVEDTPVFGLRFDHAVSDVRISLNSTESEEIESASVGPDETVFVELPGLPTGSHRLEVKWCAEASPSEEEIGVVDIVVRRAEVWDPSKNMRGAFRTHVDPPSPSLEELWENRLKVDSSGPRGCVVTCGIEFIGSDGERLPPGKRSLPPLALPAGPEDWREHFEEHLRRGKVGKSLRNAYDLAQQARVSFTSRGLGAHTVALERRFTPVRWAARRHGDSYLLRLIDDSGMPLGDGVYRYSFEKPDQAEPRDSAEFIRGTDASPCGGLYWAEAGSHAAGIVVPPTFQGKMGLQDLRPEPPQMETCTRSEGGLWELLEVAQMWAAARLVGELLSAIWRGDTARALLQHAFATICGERWTRAEGAYLRTTDASCMEPLLRAMARGHDEGQLAHELAARCPRLREEQPAARVAETAAVIDDYLDLGEDETLLVEFALRAASSPDTLIGWSEEDIDYGVEILLDNPAFARAARLVVLGVASCGQPLPLESSFLYQGWEWH